jgi:hypothetical protein
MNIKRMTEEDFRNEGFLQEVNRKFFHPLGLALSMEIGKDKDGDVRKFWGIIDYRDDPVGMLFDESLIDPFKIEHVEELRMSKIAERVNTGECDDNGIQILKGDFNA